jgi:hypothetical protein
LALVTSAGCEQASLQATTSRGTRQEEPWSVNRKPIWLRTCALAMMQRRRDRDRWVASSRSRVASYEKGRRVIDFAHFWKCRCFAPESLAEQGDRTLSVGETMDLEAASERRSQRLRRSPTVNVRGGHPRTPLTPYRDRLRRGDLSSGGRRAGASHPGPGLWCVSLDQPNHHSHLKHLKHLNRLNRLFRLTHRSMRKTNIVSLGWSSRAREFFGMYEAEPRDVIESTHHWC